jgi:hypothetical protein
MTGHRIVKAEPESEDEGDRRFEPKRQYHDVGPALADADFRPRIFGNPEQILAEAFLKAGRDYAGLLPADFMLRAVLTPEA